MTRTLDWDGCDNVRDLGGLPAEDGGETPLEPASRVRETYFHQLVTSRENAAHVVAEIANAPDGGVLVHCMGGKDRTGMLSALLLRLAGVSPEVIADDYYESEVNLAHLTERWIASGENEAERTRRAWLAPISREGMVGVLEKLEERYGSVEEYLLGGGATADDLARVRARLRQSRLAPVLH